MSAAAWRRKIKERKQKPWLEGRGGQTHGWLTSSHLMGIEALQKSGTPRVAEKKSKALR